MLQKEKDLNNEVNFHKVVDETLAENYKAIHGIDESKRLEFEGILSKVMNGEEMIEKPTGQSRSIVRRLWPLAALAAAAAIFFFMISSPNLSNLADQNYSHYIYKTDAILGEADAIEAYQNKDYHTFLENIKDLPVGDLKLQLAKGNAEYNLGKYDEAIQSFEEVKAKTGNQSFKNYANWYLALTYLKKENKNQATTLLKQLSEDSDYYAQSKILLEKLQ